MTLAAGFAGCLLSLFIPRDNLESLTKPKINDNLNHQKHEAGEENH
jgi:hypothetical protein